MKKEYLLFGLGALLLVEIGLEGFSLYQRMSANQVAVLSPVTEGTKMDLSGSPIAGDPKQDAVLVEFSDFECPYCIRHATTVMSRLREEYVDTGRLRYAFVNLPLASHANAMFLASAAACADEQDRFWQMHDRLFEGQPRTRTAVISLASELRLEPTSFESCLDNPAMKVRIERDIERAQKLEINTTPRFALGRLDDTGVVSVELLIRGAQSFEVFAAAITDFLDINRKK